MKNVKMILVMNISMLMIFFSSSLIMVNAASPQSLSSGSEYAFTIQSNDSSQQQIYQKNNEPNTQTVNFLLKYKLTALSTSTCFGYASGTISPSSHCSIGYQSQNSYFYNINPNWSSNQSANIDANSTFSGLLSVSGGSNLINIIYFWYFIEPNWALINQNFKNALTTQHTSLFGDTQKLSDFLSKANSFSLMGQSNINSSLDQFTSTTTHWYGEFVFNSLVSINSKLSNTYDFKFDVTYSSQGVLTHALVQVKWVTDYDTIFNSDEVTLDKSVDQNVNYGNATPGFELLALLTIPAIVGIRKIKTLKNRRSDL